MQSGRMRGHIMTMKGTIETKSGNHKYDRKQNTIEFESTNREAVERQMASLIREAYIPMARIDALWLLCFNGIFHFNEHIR